MHGLFAMSAGMVRRSREAAPMTTPARPGMRPMPGRALVHCLLAVALLGLNGCVALPAMPPMPMPARVAGVPYFPQTGLQCGPAALASLLAVARLPQTVPTLSGWMFTPALGGSLQADILGAARRAGGVPVRIGGDLPSLRAQLAAGRPVLVLQNLGVPRWPHWHYVVVTAIDPDASTLTIGAPDGAAETQGVRSFARAWRDADHWAIVVLRPGDAPAGLARADYLDAVAALESIGASAAAAPAYAAGLVQWPADVDFLFGAANVAATLGKLAEAGSGLEAVLQQQPGHVAALNNLAEVRRREGRLADAERLARRALELARPGAERAAVLDTLEGIRGCGEDCVGRE